MLNGYNTVPTCCVISSSHHPALCQYSTKHVNPPPLCTFIIARPPPPPPSKKTSCFTWPHPTRGWGATTTTIDGCNADGPQPDVELANVADGDRGLMDLMKYTDEGAEGGRRGSALSASRKLFAGSHGLTDGGCSAGTLPSGGLAAADGEVRISLQHSILPMRRSSNGSGPSTRSLEGGGVRPTDPNGLGSSSSAREVVSPFGRRSSRRPILPSIESADIALKDPELQQ